MPLSPDIEKRLDAAKAISDTRERIVAIAHVATSIAKQGDLETALGVTKEIDSSLGPVALVRFRGEGDRIRELVIHDFCKANSPEGRTDYDRGRQVDPDELLPFYRSPRARQAAADALNKRKAKGS